MEIERPLVTTSTDGRKLIRNEFTGVVVSSQILVSPDDDLQEIINNVKSTGNGGSILLRNGTYTPSSNIVVPSDITISGETEGGVIIDFDSQALQIKCEGTDIYNAGSINATNASATVTGNGTNWTSDMVGRSIIIKGIYYAITAVTDVNTLTIEAPHEEATVTSYPYAICSPKTNVLIENMTIKNSTHADGALSYKFVNACRQRDITITDSTVGFYYELSSGCFISGFTAIGNGTGVKFRNGGAWTFNDFFLLANTGIGMDLDRVTSCSISNSSVSSNGSSGVKFTNCSDMDFSAQTIISNTSHGIELESCQDLEFFGLTPKFNGGSGMRMTSSNQRIGVSLTSFINNGAYGVNIVDSTNSKNTITSCFFSGNSSGTINNNGTSTITANNQT